MKLISNIVKNVTNKFTVQIIYTSEFAVSVTALSETFMPLT